MKRTLLSGILAAIVLATPVRAGDITYNLLSDTSVQNGWTLSGTVTTDGTIGQLSSSDIVSWTFTVSKSGQTPITASSSDGGAYADASGLYATQSALTTYSESEYTQVKFEGSAAYVKWDLSEFRLYDFVSGNKLWDTFPNTTNLPKGGTWTIATASVPEPSSVVMGLIGGLSAMGYSLYRRHRSTRRQDAIAA